MKTLLPAVALALALASALSACTPPSGDAVTVTTAFIAQVQAEAKLACSVVPTAASIAALFTDSPEIATVSGIATAICDAVGATRTASARGVHAPVKVRGVTVYFKKA